MGRTSAFPLDGAPHARNLFRGAAAGFGDRLHGLEQIAPGIRNRRRLRRIQAAAILQLEIPVETEEVWRTRCVVGARHVLRFVPQVGEREIASSRATRFMLSKESSG